MPLATDCDITVIGSGMGGLVAAALLAQQGYKTIVVERLPRIGGRCSTVEYQGFKCITGVIGVEMGGAVEEVFRTVGADFNVKRVGPPHYLIRGRVCRVPPKGGMKALLSETGSDNLEIERVLRAFSLAMGWMEPVGTMNLRDWLQQYTRNKTILDVFQTMVSATQMVNTDELPAGELFRFLKGLGGIKNFGFCPEGSIALVEALATKIRDRRGEIWTETPGSRILVEKGIARGVKVTRNGKEWEIRSSVVVSNAGPHKTVELAAREHFDKAYPATLEREVHPAMLVCLQIAADEPLIEQDYLMVTGARRVNALYQPTMICPELAPPGKHLLFAGAARGSSLPPLDARKELEWCARDLEDLIPDFEKRARILLLGTFHKAWPGMHCWPGKDLPQKTPVMNLYNVGDGAKPAGTPVFLLRPRVLWPLRRKSSQDGKGCDAGSKPRKWDLVVRRKPFLVLRPMLGNK